MIAPNYQLPLFAPQKPAIQPAPKGPEPVYTLHEVVTGFLDRKRAGCRNCHCTDANPCGLATGDKCFINQRTGYCSAPQCQAAAARARTQPMYAHAGGR